MSAPAEIQRLVDDYGQACAARGGVSLEEMAHALGTAIPRGALLDAVEAALSAETKLREEAQAEAERQRGLWSSIRDDLLAAAEARADFEKRRAEALYNANEGLLARATRAEGALREADAERDAARALLFDLAAAVRLLEEFGSPVSPLAKMRRINAEALLGEKAVPAIPSRYDFRTKRAARAAGEAQKEGTNG
jgi:hypothetical protein